VFAGAVVPDPSRFGVQPCNEISCSLPDGKGGGTTQGLFVESDLVQHLADNGNVNRISIVGSTGNRKLLPGETRPRSLSDKRLEGFRRRSQIEHPVDIARPDDKGSRMVENGHGSIVRRLGKAGTGPHGQRIRH
jgi:hypothetical protein